MTRLNIDPARAGGVRNAAGPFDHDDAALLEQFAKADGVEIVRSADTVGVEVKDLQPAGVVDIEEHEGGTGNGTRIAAKSEQQAAGELGFAGAEFAMQRDALAADERLGEFSGD